MSVESLRRMIVALTLLVDTAGDKLRYRVIYTSSEILEVGGASRLVCHLGGQMGRWADDR